MVHLPENAAFDLRAPDYLRAYHDDHALAAKGSQRPRRFYGKVRGGGPLVALSTSSGSIRVD